jgi:general secretion pathway protein G
MAVSVQGSGQKLRRGDTVTQVRSAERRVVLSAANGGFSLIELVIILTIMTILTLGVIPLVKVSVKRQKEQDLRYALRQMRMAIDEFHRDTVGMICAGTTAGAQTQGVAIDPRSRVVITDCTIFGVDNPDRYPPDLDTLVNGVNVQPRGVLPGGRGDPNVAATQVGSTELATKKKVYLRAIPIDPMTGKPDWAVFSCYDPPDADSTGGENLFDVRSKSTDMALNGEKYSDW